MSRHRIKFHVEVTITENLGAGANEGDVARNFLDALNTMRFAQDVEQMNPEFKYLTLVNVESAEAADKEAFLKSRRFSQIERSYNESKWNQGWMYQDEYYIVLCESTGGFMTYLPGEDRSHETLAQAEEFLWKHLVRGEKGYK